MRAGLCPGADSSASPRFRPSGAFVGLGTRGSRFSSGRIQACQRVRAAPGQGVRQRGHWWMLAPWGMARDRRRFDGTARSELRRGTEPECAVRDQRPGAQPRPRRITDRRVDRRPRRTRSARSPPRARVNDVDRLLAVKRVGHRSVNGPALDQRRSSACVDLVRRASRADSGGTCPSQPRPSAVSGGLARPASIGDQSTHTRHRDNRRRASRSSGAAATGLRAAAWPGSSGGRG